MEKNQLIHIGRVIRPGGGPSGYLYNLKEIAAGKKSKKIKVYAFNSSNERSGASANKAGLIILSLPYIFRKYYVRMLLVIRQLIDVCSIFKIIFKIQDAYPVFHDQMLAYWYGKLFSKSYCLMPHQPIEAAREADDIYKYKYNLNKNDIYFVLVKKEVYAYENASMIVCPTHYSLDSYFQFNCEYREKLKAVPKHLVVSTVTLPKQILGRLKTREALNINSKEIAIGFIGRYNSDKGYDRFQSIAKSHQSNHNISFFSAGAGELAEDDENVINLGWRKDIADIISAMDLIIIPNRVTYFDLLPIESLMLGTPVAITGVGGNRWLLDEAKDSCIQELIINDNDGSSNFSQIIKTIPERVQFKDTSIFEFFEDGNFISSHESLNQKLKDLRVCGYE
jgi:glycosyltransferase involved in cell wall biosynthesis